MTPQQIADPLQSMPMSRRMQLLIEAVIDYAIYLLDANGIVTSWNPGAERIKGYAASEILGEHFSRFFTEEDRKAGVPAELLAHAAKEGRCETEGWRVRKDGRRFRALVVIDAIKDEAGRLIGFAKITRDVTDRFKAEQALRDSERLFRLLVAGVTDYAIYMLDPSGIITTWNAGAERAKGYRADEVIGRSFSTFYTEEDRKAGKPQWALETARREGRFEAEGLRVRKDGTTFWTNVVIDALRDEQGQLIGFAKITRDITDKKKAEEMVARAREQLAVSQKMEALGQLTGGIAHDFNNLLMIVGGQAEMMGKRLGEPRDVRAVDAIRTAVGRGESLTRQLLAFSRKTALRSEVLAIGERIAQFRDMIASPLPVNISLKIDIPHDIWNVELDVAEFEFALINIVVNARDAMPDGGVIAITAANETLDGTAEPAGLKGDFVALKVTDNGTGIAPEIMDRIFDPFFTTKQVDKGTGLGLSQVYGFARQSKGAVTVESEVGRGTAITLYFSRSLAKPASGRKKRPDGKPAPAVGTVLLVEDNAEVANVTSTLLAELGYGVVHAASPDAALALLKSRDDVALILSDIVMPGSITGVELAEKVRSENPSLPILLTTGYAKASEGVGKRFPILRKPYQIAALDRAIRQAMK